MMSTSLPYCDCCSLALSNVPSGGDCPRCGYPVDALKEEHFLQRTVDDLQRVATYGGASLTIVQLIQRYQARLNYLQRQKTQTHEHKEQAPVLDTSQRPAAPVKSPPTEQTWQPSISAQIQADEQRSIAPFVTPTVSVQSSQKPPARMFSLKSF